MRMKKIIDLTQTLKPGMPDWDGCCGFHMQIHCDYEKENLRTHVLSMPAGIGTHIDAPNHFFQNAPDVTQLDFSQLFVQGIVLDVSAKADENYLIDMDDIKEFEKKYGAISENTFVIAHTGWEEFWHNPVLYRNANASGAMNFPAYSSSAIDYLLEKNIAGIGIDTLSPDGGNLEFPVHKKILGADKYIVENLCQSSKLPPRDFQVFILPMKIAGATEAPCRIVALLS